MRRILLICVVALALPVGAAHAAGNPIIAAAKRTVEVKSTTMQMNVTTKIRGRVATTLTGTGAQRGTNVKLAMRTTAAGQAVTMDAVMLSEGGAYVMYMRSPAFGAQLPPGKSWLRVDLSKQAASTGVDFSSLLNSAQTFAPLEKGIVSTKRVGREEVAGAATTHYRAIVDVKRAARAVPEYGKQVAAVERTTGVRLGRSTWDVWIAGDGRIRRMSSSTPAAVGGARGTTSQTITFLSFNRPVSISAPPPAQVFSP